MGTVDKPIEKLIELYQNRFDFGHLDSEKQSQIEALRSRTTKPFPVGKDEEEGRFDEVAASPNVKNQSDSGINHAQ
jgi:hypothetical protein